MRGNYKKRTMSGVKMVFLCRMAVIILCLSLPSAVAGAEQEWEYLYTKKGIDVFSKSVPGSRVSAFKGVGFVEAGLEVVSAVIRDIPSYPRWVARCKRAFVLKDIDANTKVFYSVLSTPGPFKDRDVIVVNDTVFDFDHGIVRLFFRLSDEQLLPLNEKYQRVTELTGEYRLEYFGRYKTRVIFEYHGDPGGNVPIRIVEWIESKNHPYYNLMGIRRMVREQKYVEAGMHSSDKAFIDTAGSDTDRIGKILKNRMNDYLVDRQMLDIIFETQAVRDMIKGIHAQNATYASILQAVAGVFSVFSSSPAVAACIKDKRLEDIVCLETIMREKWIIDLIVKERQRIERGLNIPGGNFEKIYYKITTSEKALKRFIHDDDLARTILTDESFRTRLWQDKGLKKEVLDKFVSFESVRDFEKIVAAHVDQFE